MRRCDAVAALLDPVLELLHELRAGHREVLLGRLGFAGLLLGRAVGERVRDGEDERPRATRATFRVRDMGGSPSGATLSAPPS
jgi:hypothetical protein